VTGRSPTAVMPNATGCQASRRQPQAELSVASLVKRSMPRCCVRTSVFSKTVKQATSRDTAEPQSNYLSRCFQQNPDQEIPCFTIRTKRHSILCRIHVHAHQHVNAADYYTLSSQGHLNFKDISIIIALTKIITCQ
jgi:hypothetical protein